MQAALLTVFQLCTHGMELCKEHFWLLRKETRHFTFCLPRGGQWEPLTRNGRMTDDSFGDFVLLSLFWRKKKLRPPSAFCSLLCMLLHLLLPFSLKKARIDDDDDASKTRSQTTKGWMWCLHSILRWTAAYIGTARRDKSKCRNETKTSVLEMTPVMLYFKSMIYGPFPIFISTP